MSITALPSMEHTFTVKIEGNDTKQIWEGTFCYKRPNIRIETEIDKTAAILNGGIPGLTEDTVFLHEVLATLKHTLIKYPEWFEKSDYGYELHDSNVIFELYKETRKFEKDWRDKVWLEETPEEEAPKASEKAKAKKDK